MLANLEGKWERELIISDLDMWEMTAYTEIAVIEAML